ncbi:IS5/IS1182 family transposase, partial [Enterococcus hirae]
FHLRGKQGATIDIGLALMALNLRKLGKYMERKVRKTEKISSILTINIKIELIFFLRKNYCPTLSLFLQKVIEKYILDQLLPRQ